jgi:nucleotidyltransferase/DNA polymerase involved in DNA repair
MWMPAVRELCPDVTVIPYEVRLQADAPCWSHSTQFEKYELVSRQMYQIFVRYTDKIEVCLCCVLRSAETLNSGVWQALSCDEALLDVTGLDGEKTAACIRAEIERTTGCTASAGICTLRLTMIGSRN